MNFKIDAIPNFKREAKQLVKKFHSLKNELANLDQALQNDPYTGIPTILNSTATITLPVIVL